MWCIGWSSMFRLSGAWSQFTSVAFPWKACLLLPWWLLLMSSRHDCKWLLVLVKQRTVELLTALERSFEKKALLLSGRELEVGKARHRRGGGQRRRKDVARDYMGNGQRRQQGGRVWPACPPTLASISLWNGTILAQGGMAERRTRAGWRAGGTISSPCPGRARGSVSVWWRKDMYVNLILVNNAEKEEYVLVATWKPVLYPDTIYICLVLFEQPVCSDLHLSLASPYWPMNYCSDGSMLILGACKYNSLSLDRNKTTALF